MMHHSYRWLRRFQTYLSLEVLEARTPVSEGLSPALTLAALGRLAHAQATPPPSYPAYK